MSELDKLEKYLKEHGYSYEREDRNDTMSTRNWHQVIVYDGDERLWDAVCHYGSYGYEDGLLEIYGSIVWEDIDDDSVRGWLTADDVISRIEKGREGATR